MNMLPRRDSSGIRKGPSWLVCKRIGRACISVDADRYDCERIADKNSLSQIFCDSRKDYGLFSSMSL